MASLVFSMSVKDEAFRAGMAQARAEASKTEQNFERSGTGMAAAIDRTAREVNAAAIRMVDSLGRASRAVRDSGLALTAGLTLPLGAMAAVSKKTASDFQAAMNQVHSAIVSAKPEDLEKLRAAALELGPAFGRSAIEAAGAIESLARNGMSAADILGGGLRSALTLAVTGQTDLASSSDLTTDILEQFSRSTADLPDIVNRVVGALDASKLSFDDYRLAAGQAGGVAGSLGYTFEDFNTALAATAPLFDSGSQAGTSFRAFLTSLAGKSEDSRKAMEKLGLELYNTDGSAKSLAAIADELQKKMGNLSDRSKNVALDKMFGADGGQTAVALIKLGAEGINDVAAAIDSVTAGQKMSILLDGEAAATQRLATAWERLKIAIGEAGIIQAFTLIKNVAADVVAGIAALPSGFFTVTVAVGALAASAGPLTLAMLGIAKIALPLLLLRLGPVALAFASIINPAGVLIRLLAQLAITAGAGMAIGRLGVAMLGFAGPVGLVITGLLVLYPLLTRTAVASDTMRAAVDAARKAEESARDVSLQLASATGKAREEILKKAQADRIAARDAMKKAQADMQAARASYVRAKADAAQASTLGSNVGDADGGINVGAVGANGRLANRAADFQASIDALDLRIKALSSLNGAIAGANAPVSKIDMSFDDLEKAKKGRKGRDTSADDEDYAAKLADVRNAQLQAQADLTGGIEARYRADMDSLVADRAAYAKQLATDDALNAAKRSTLMAEKDAELVIRRAIVEQTRSNALTQESYDLTRAINDARQEVVRAEIDVADSAAGRGAGELRLLDLQRQQEDADLDLILATKNSATAEWANAEKRKSALSGIYAQRAEAIARQNEGPSGAFMRELNRSSGAIAEDVERGGVEALRDLNTGITDAILGTAKLADAFQNMGKRIIASLIDITIQQRLIKPLAEGLLGTGSGGGLLSSIGAMLGLVSGTDRTGITSAGLGGAPGLSGFDMPALPNFAGFRAAGGGVGANDWVIVGEKGPEIFAPGVSGTVIPNGGRGTRSTGGGNFTYAPTFDARGAGPREIDALRAEMRRESAALPGRVMATMADAKTRSFGR